MRVKFIASFLALSISAALAQADIQTEPFPHFKMAQGQTDRDRLPVSGARICAIGAKNICYTMPPSTEANSRYEFGLEPHSERLQLASGGSWIFFTAMFSGGGSGTLTRLAILRYGAKEEKIVNLLPYVAATNVSDYAVWNLKEISPYPVLVHADFIWSPGEIHFGAHFYSVEAWTYDSQTGNYKKAFSYRTSKKYDGGDVIPVRVLKYERSEIIRRLAK